MQKIASLIRERHSSSTSSPDGVFGLPLKSRYSGGVWGGEGTQYDGTTEAGTPGSGALWGSGGTILTQSRGGGVGGDGRRVRRVDYECPLSAVPDVQPSAVSIQLMPFVCPE